MKNPRLSNQFTRSPDLRKDYQTEVTSFSPNYLNTYLAEETIKGKKIFHESDMNPLVKDICTKCSTLIEQPNFRFQIFFSR